MNKQNKVTPDFVPVELRTIQGVSWYRDEVNEQIQELIEETPTQKRILFFATEEMLKTLEDATETGIDGTFDLSSKEFKVFKFLFSGVKIV